MPNPQARRLLTVDEARAAFAESALGLCECGPPDPLVLLGLLYGEPITAPLPPDIAELADAHRQHLLDIRFSGHDWILTDEIEGALSYAGCALDTVLHAA